MCEHQPQLNNIERSIGTLEGKVGFGFQEITSRLDSLDKRIIAQGEKIDKLEEGNTQMKVWASILGVIGGGAISMIFGWFKNKL